ncbi:hypothetical protein EJ06DRAFT_281312 [Trichodelitschia bisporula]|uniref:Uncharacterized protein n=1 Tax=Trichodelitschia bisporula TaxID=703511 RepID=A0A6G1I5H3_9PEZI|nr:hypothetical protein EJ06DRAFT_281312 [Trichodelitschia bisporula]
MLLAPLFFGLRFLEGDSDGARSDWVLFLYSFNLPCLWDRGSYLRLGSATEDFWPCTGRDGMGIMSTGFRDWSRGYQRGHGSRGLGGGSVTQRSGAGRGALFLDECFTSARGSGISFPFRPSIRLFLHCGSAFSRFWF